MLSNQQYMISTINFGKIYYLFLYFSLIYDERLKNNELLFLTSFFN